MLIKEIGPFIDQYYGDLFFCYSVVDSWFDVDQSKDFWLRVYDRAGSERVKAENLHYDWEDDYPSIDLVTRGGHPKSTEITIYVFEFIRDNLSDTFYVSIVQEVDD